MVDEFGFETKEAGDGLFESNDELRTDCNGLEEILLNRPFSDTFCSELKAVVEVTGILASKDGVSDNIAVFF